MKQKDHKFKGETKVNVVATLVVLLLMAIAIYSLGYNNYQHKKIKKLKKENLKIEKLEKENRKFKNKNNLIKQQQQQTEYLNNRAIKKQTQNIF